MSFDTITEWLEIVVALGLLGIALALVAQPWRR
jgi:hypothetical protein